MSVLQQNNILCRQADEAPVLEILRNKKEWEADSRVGLKVSIVDSFNELLCDLYDLLFASCTGETKATWEQCDSNQCGKSNLTMKLQNTKLDSWRSTHTSMSATQFTLTYEPVTHRKSHQSSLFHPWVESPCYCTHKNYFHAKSCVVSLSKSTGIILAFLKKNKMLLCLAAVSLSTSIRHPSYLLFACEAASAHHAILVPAL